MEDQTLARKAIAEMSSDDYTALRDAYYKAMEGLNALQRELQGIKDLRPEHRIAGKAAASLHQSMLGAIL